jgi:hypothetical protein
MSEVTRDDINVIFQKLDKQTETLTAVQIDLATVKQKVNDMPPAPKQPCDTLTTHINDHKNTVASWRKPIIVGIIVTVFLFIQEPIKMFFRKIFLGG